MNKKKNRMAVRQAAQQAVIRDEQNHRIYQCVYSDTFLSGSRFYYDRYGFSILFSGRKFTGRF